MAIQRSKPRWGDGDELHDYWSGGDQRGRLHGGGEQSRQQRDQQRGDPDGAFAAGHHGLADQPDGVGGRDAEFERYASRPRTV